MLAFTESFIIHINHYLSYTYLSYFLSPFFFFFFFMEEETNGKRTEQKVAYCNPFCSKNLNLNLDIKARWY